jgi:hypothetical protein
LSNPSSKRRVYQLSYEQLLSVIEAPAAERLLVSLDWQSFVLLPLSFRPGVAIAWPTHDGKTVLLHRGKEDYRFMIDNDLGQQILGRLGENTPFTKLLFPCYG